MGIYDRDYFRPTQPARSSLMPRTVVGILVVINVAVWLAECICESRFSLMHLLSAHVLTVPGQHWWWQADTLTHPWLWWQYLTAGFTHAANNVPHILFNMLVLWFLWPARRTVLRREGIPPAVSGDAGLFALRVEPDCQAGQPRERLRLRRIGALAGIVVLTVLNFPKLTVLFMFIIPMPMWLAGALVVGADMLGALGGSAGSDVAYTAHLAGAAFAAVYFWRRWNLTGLTEGFSWPRLPWRRKPPLAIHRPDREESTLPNLEQEVERILAKITSQGQSSLTAKERATLEAASLEYRKRQGKR